MTNKYQEALDKIKSCTNIIIDKGENYELVKNQVPQECFDSLQELVDKYGAMYEDMIEDAKFLKEVVEPNLKILKETYRCKPVTVLETPDSLEDNIAGNVVSNRESIIDFKKEIDILNHTIDKYEQDILDYEKALELLSILKPHFYFETSGQECEPIIKFNGIQIPWFREEDPTYSTSDYCKVKEWLLKDE